MQHLLRPLCFSLLLLLACRAAGQPARPASTPPNVIFILMDDMGYADIAPFGAKDIRTPALDRLAREGVKLTDNYANGPVCTPTRAAVITGRYNSASGSSGRFCRRKKKRDSSPARPRLPARSRSAVMRRR